MGPCWHTCLRLCHPFPLHKGRARQASHRLKFLLLLASVVTASATWTATWLGSSSGARCLHSSTGPVLTPSLSPRLVSGGQGTARPEVPLPVPQAVMRNPPTARQGSGRLRACFGPPHCLHGVPITGLPLLSPHLTAAALAPRELRRCPGMGPCTRRQTQAGAHTAPALSRLKPGSGRLISHGLQEHTGLRGTEPRCRGITFSSLRAAAAASSSKRRFAPGW